MIFVSVGLDELSDPLMSYVVFLNFFFFEGSIRNSDGSFKEAKSLAV